MDDSMQCGLFQIFPPFKGEIDENGQYKMMVGGVKPISTYGIDRETGEYKTYDYYNEEKKQ